MSLGPSRMRAMLLGGLAALMVVAFGASSAWAEASTHCVKATKVSKIISGKTKHVFTGGWNDKGCMSVNATHEGKFEKLASFTEPEEQQLKALLKYVNVQPSGVGGKPTVKLTGANLQVASGPKEEEINGVGNVVIGADEVPRTQTGSNNLVLGGREQEFTSYGGIVAGAANAISQKFASVTGGASNIASGGFASVSGGFGNTASGGSASVSGGNANTAKAVFSSVSGGELAMAGGLASWIGGGAENEIINEGLAGKEGNWASIFGGKKEKTATDYAAIP